MALATVDNLLGSFVVGDRRVVIADFAFDSSYPTGGESLTPANLGFTSRIDFLFAEPKSGYNFVYDRANQKLLAYYNDYDAVADGAHIQVPDTTNLSSLSAVRVFAVGV